MNKLRILLQLFLFGITLLSLTACGFHLRGQNDLPPALHTLYLQADDPYGSFTTQLIAVLRDSNVTLVDDPSQAAIILNVSAPTQSIVGNTVGNSNQARVYAVTYTMRFSLLSQHGKTLLRPQTLVARTTLTLNANQLLESNNQLAQTERDLQRDIINQLFNRLISQQVFQAVASQPIVTP